MSEAATKKIKSCERCSRSNPCRECGKDHWCINLPTTTLCTEVASDHWNEGLAGWLHPLPGESWDTIPDERPERVQRPARPGRATIASLAKRHQVYTKMVGLLQLTPEHWEHLGSARRGMSPAEIEARGYRTAYVYGGAPADAEDRAFDLAGKLESAGDLHTVPGFGSRQRGSNRAGDRVAAAICLSPRILTPLRSVEDLIQGYQMFDPDPACDRKRRYLFFSGVGDTGATISKPLHVSRPVGKASGKHVIITEGPLKADIVSTRTGSITIAFQGVKAIDWDALGQVLAALGNPPVVLALDADRKRNPDVRQAHEQLCAWLEQRGHAYKVAEWDERDGKGLDDLLLAGKKPRFVDPVKSEATVDASEAHPTRAHIEQGLITSMWSDFGMARRLARTSDSSFKDAACRKAHAAIKELIDEVDEAEFNPLTVSTRMLRRGDQQAVEALTKFETANRNHLTGARHQFEREFRRELLTDAMGRLVGELQAGLSSGDPSALAQKAIEGATAILATADTRKRPTMKDEFYEWIDKQLAGEPPAHYITLGIPSVDELLGPVPLRSLGIIAGAPKMGKSTLAMVPIFHNARSGVECIVGQLEMTKDQVFRRAAAWHFQKPYRGPGSFDTFDLRKIRKSGALDWFENIHLVTGHTSIDSYRGELVNILTRNRKIRLVMTDYAEQLMQHGGKSNRVDEADAGSDFAKKLAIQFDLCHILLVQYKKEYTESGHAGARLNHLKNSGKYEQDAQFVLLLHHPHRFDENITRNFVLAKVAANRDGGVGDRPLYWTPELFRYEAWDIRPVIPDPEDPDRTPGHGPIPAGAGKNLKDEVKLTSAAERFRERVEKNSEYVGEVDWPGV